MIPFFKYTIWFCFLSVYCIHVFAGLQSKDALKKRTTTDSISDITNSLTDREVELALSNLSVSELNALSKFLDQHSDPSSEPDAVDSNKELLTFYERSNNGNEWYYDSNDEPASNDEAAAYQPNSFGMSNSQAFLYENARAKRRDKQEEEDDDEQYLKHLEYSYPRGSKGSELEENVDEENLHLLENSFPPQQKHDEDGEVKKKDNLQLEEGDNLKQSENLFPRQQSQEKFEDVEEGDNLENVDEDNLSQSENSIPSVPNQKELKENADAEYYTQLDNLFPRNKEQCEEDAKRDHTQNIYEENLNQLENSIPWVPTEEEIEEFRKRNHIPNVDEENFNQLENAFPLEQNQNELEEVKKQDHLQNVDEEDLNQLESAYPRVNSEDEETAEEKKLNQMQNSLALQLKQNDAEEINKDFVQNIDEYLKQLDSSFPPLSNQDKLEAVKKENNIHNLNEYYLNQLEKEFPRVKK